MSFLFKTLENEFCPPLDSSLLAALFAEIETENAQKSLTVSSPEIVALRHTLRELATHADAAQLTELADLSLTSPTEDTASSQDAGLGAFTADTSFSSQSSSGSSDYSFSSPLGFLQAALPDAPLHALKKALAHAEKDGKDLDLVMWDLVATILSMESIRELEERGLDALDEQDGVFREEDVQWEVATPRTRKTHTPTSPVKRKQGRGTKITLIDIRQQNHGKPESKATSKPPLPDLWTLASSIATLIATFLPPHSPSFFLSYLHSPKYETPYHALCSALEDLSEPSRSLDEDSKMLLTLLDVLFPQYEPLDSEQRSRLVHETQLAIRATRGRGNDVFDIVKLLRELDSDFSSGKWELGIYHLPPQRPPPSPIITTGSKLSSPPLSPLATLKPPSQLVPLVSPRLKKIKPDPYQWQTVPARPVPDDSPHPLAQSIPAYAHTTVDGRKIKGGGNEYGKGGKDDVGEMPLTRSRIQRHRLKQEEYLKQAAKMWQRGDKKSRGGEIAFYYAEKAREFQALAKQEALENARIMVYAKKSSTGKYDEIDLHGTTVFEAITIVKEVLQETRCSPSQPFKIITGKGSHSVNKVGILKPAIRNALVEEGWAVGSWEGGLVVRGRNF
ncbi:hypothetical protein AGABI1DRAFT_70625 [Agaricus bisporus var. burnettii JB137-S8]|uniref:Smr domain-containing protein n=1 Tax=Agaricus bisporus var. burnettii (strain JB137-S8 / ATCC MYA-4627 / FGSC 10392) TaxID=597362 RepID=K5Y2D0_AGABU|nr:uncharacterized protein AGABI1DRAFT_70625 [Agaricus bisporus var. burnettii JB137-S8]EKM82015.1 hypothetical protein AGABI1DRAFT_70625 [Agaricus bisporus var. burnettii JB137-S8]